MPPILTDEHIAHALIRGLLGRNPGFELTRVQEVGLRRAADQTNLAWAAAHGHVVLSHDRATMPGAAYERIGRGEIVPGVVVQRSGLSIGAAIEALTILIQCTRDDEWANRIYHLPL